MEYNSTKTLNFTLTKLKDIDSNLPSMDFCLSLDVPVFDAFRHAIMNFRTEVFFSMNIETNQENTTTTSELSSPNSVNPNLLYLLIILFLLTSIFIPIAFLKRKQI